MAEGPLRAMTRQPKARRSTGAALNRLARKEYLHRLEVAQSLAF